MIVCISISNQFVIEDITGIGYTVNKRYRFFFLMEHDLTHIPVSVTSKPMGKPPLNKDSETKPTQVRLTADLRARIEAAAGPNRMASFIREAIENELVRRESKEP
jgi:hypothetical protein